MYGINNQPLCELDEFIDVATFAALKDEMDAGIAMSDWEPGSFGPGVYEKQLNRDLYNIEEVFLAQADDVDAKEVRAVLAKMPTLSQRRRYLKLRYGLYNSSHSVYLRKPIGHDYFSISSAEKCEWTEDANYFPNLRNWIEGLPFASVGRVLFFINEHMCPVVPHSDLKHSRESKGYVANHRHAHEFVWIRPNIAEGKKLFVMDESSGRKRYVKGHSCWFNSFDVHGADPSSVMTYSLRVDGVFSDELRKKLGVAA